MSCCEGHYELYCPVISLSNFWIMSQCDTTFDLKINVGHSDLYFMVQWFCLTSQRLFDGWVIISDETVWHVWPQNKYRSQWPIFHGPEILPYISKTIWASSWDYGTYHIGDQQRLSQACADAISPEPSLFAHMKYGSRQRVWWKMEHLAPLDGCACVFEEWIYGGRKVP